MSDLRFTLLSDGSFDRALLGVLRWLLADCGVTGAIQPSWADLRRLPAPGKQLDVRIRQALDLYPCDLIFLHRDSERQVPEQRRREITRAVQRARLQGEVPIDVPVVPVRMTEAWLLFDEQLIRTAASNPSGTVDLQLPARANWEAVADPKNVLHAALVTASGLSGRRRSQFDAHRAAARISELATTFHLLRGLQAFDALEADVRSAVQASGWDLADP